jgi:hypothetical protein
MAYLGKTPSQAVRSRYYFTASGGETSLAPAQVTGLSFTDANYVDVSLNGVALVSGTDYTATPSTNTISSLSALTASDVVEIVVYDTFSVFGGSVNGDFTISNGTLAAEAVTSTGVDVTGNVTMTSDDPTITMTDSSGTNDIATIQATSGALIVTARDGSADGEIIFKKTDGSATDETLRITSGGNVGIGTDSPETILHATASSAIIRLTSDANGTSGVDFGDSADTNIGRLLYDNSDNSMRLTTNASERMRITSGGNVGIGTSNPDATAHLEATNASLLLSNSGRSQFFRIQNNETDDALVFNANDTSERMRITSGGNVGIGTTSITTGTLGSSNRFLEVSAGTENGSGTLVLSRNTSANNQEIGGVRFVNQNNSTDGSNNNSGKLVAAISGRSVTTDSNAGDDSGGVLVFNTKPETGTLAERMRIDSSGNLLVGGTNSTPHNLTSGGGFSVRGSLNLLSVARQDNEAMILNRTGTDGEIVDFRKDGTTVGNIGTESNGDFVINGAGNHAGIRFVSDSLTPRYAGNDFDNGIDLGKSDARFDDIFATNGTIQTSDQQEKNTITDSDLGLDFINRLEPKSYVFNGKTRTHYGLIAQDVETVLGDISKPTSGFAGFIKSDISEEQDGSEYRYGLRYTEFVGPLIQAVKDLKAENDAMRARLTALENAE